MTHSTRFSTYLRNEVFGALILLLVWCGLTWFYPAYIIPTPWVVLAEAPAYLPVDFWRHAGVTFFRIVVGFGLAMSIGTGLGIWAYSRKWVEQVNSLMLALQVLPGTILGVIFLLLFGTGNLAPILLVVFMTLPTLAISTAHGLTKRNLKLQQYMVSIRGDSSFQFRYNYLPALVPVLQSNLSVGMGLAAKEAIMGEFIGSQDGLGYLLNNARIVFDMKEVLFYLVVLVVFTLAFQALQTLIFSRFFGKFTYPE